ncbi:hypothetical protein V6Z11_A01G102400 [Gossypium hirsutum]
MRLLCHSFQIHKHVQHPISSYLIDLIVENNPVPPRPIFFVMQGAGIHILPPLTDSQARQPQIKLTGTPLILLVIQVHSSGNGQISTPNGIIRSTQASLLLYRQACLAA